MSLASHLLKPSLAPLNFANIAIMGRIIASGLRELAGENLRRKLGEGIEAAAKAARVRPADVEKLLPMARFAELAQRLDRDQKVAAQAWTDQPVESRRSGDLAKLTEQEQLPVLADSLMRLAIMAGANAALRQALMGMSEAVREWQQLVLAAGTTLDDDRVLQSAVRRRMLQRAVLVVPLLAAAVVGGWSWHRVQQVRARLNAAIGDEDPCAVLALLPKDQQKATAAQRADIGRRAQDCQDRRDAKARAEAERAKKAAYAQQCADLAAALKQGKPPGPSPQIAGRPLALATRIAKGQLDLDDYGPKDPVLPCADTDQLAAIGAAFDHAVVGGPGFMDADDLSPRAMNAVTKLGADVPDAIKHDLDARAEREAVAALTSRNLGKIDRAKRLCKLKELLKLPKKAFCIALSK